MRQRTALSSAILKHWQAQLPQALSDLEKRSALEQSLSETEDRIGDLIYELTSVQKMNYQAAWEIAMEEMNLSEGSPQQNPPRLSSPPISGKKNRRRHGATSG